MYQSSARYAFQPSASPGFYRVSVVNFLVWPEERVLFELPSCWNLRRGDGILMPARKAVLSNMASLSPLIWLRNGEGGNRTRTLKPSYPFTLGFVR